MVAPGGFADAWLMTHTVASVVASAPADDTRFRASSAGRPIRLDRSATPFRWGSLEYLLHAATEPARLIT